VLWEDISIVKLHFAETQNIEEIAPWKMGKSDSVNDVELDNLFKMIRLGSAEEVIEAVDKYLNHTIFPDKALQQYHIDIMELMTLIYRFLMNNDIEISDFSEDIKELYCSILELEPEALQKWLLDRCLFVREKLIGTRNKSTKSFVSRAIEYVQDHYMEEELSLDHICEVLGVSNSYFSTIFKKETGSSFISYLTDYRMEQAASMLIATNEKSYMIANSVGYADPNYFSYVFKRKFGVSPSKYRGEHVESGK
ncbi:MAG: AraC family transcriptional regulator, partial [Clostridium sp.]|nr:AraC family transcriptional regulator [Clostridium sp.]